MAVLSLPLSFQNSFWSQDYRTGLEVLYSQLEKGVLENEEVVAFVRARAAAESALAATLSAAGPAGKAFAGDDGASLHVAFRGLKEESVAQGKAHEAIAIELQDGVAAPFEKWAHGYRDRLWNSRHNMLDGFMHAYEAAQGDVSKLKNDYLNKMRRADEAEDDARFAPISQPVGDKFTTSPSMQPRDKPRFPSRTPTMTERLSQRFKELRLQAGRATSPEKPEVHFDAGTDVESEKGTPKIDKGKGRALEDVASPERMASPPPMSPPLPPARLNTNPLPPPPAPPILVAGLEMAPTELSDLLTRARDTMPLRPVRFPLIGEYQDCFSGEEFATWLKENVKDFSGSLDHAAFAAKELTEKHNLLRRVGEFGNDYENANDAFYQFRAKAFELGAAPAPAENAVSPIQKTLSPMAEAVATHTTTFASLVSKALNTNGSAEPLHIRTRREAEVADREYRVAVRKLDRQRLGLEERVEETLKTLQKWELDRLRAVKTVLRQYQTAVSKLAKAYEPSLERSNVLIDSYTPEADLKVFIERHRVGPFRPEPRVYESVTHDESDVVFGIDLRRWADSAMWPGFEEKKDKPDIPPVLTLMLSSIDAAYSRLPRITTWIYDVPLPAVHHIREALNAIPPEQPFPDDILAKYDALFWLEPSTVGSGAHPPVGTYEGWDELRKLYPTASEELVANTPTAEADETNEVYITKLALTMGRTILRPKQETEFSIQDRHPTLLFMDLINKYDAIVPPAIERKKRESQRKMPVRRRTRPVDMRMSRSRISAGADLKELHAQQLAQRSGVRLSKGSPPLPPPVPSLPTVPASPMPLSLNHSRLQS
ncbi:uncharacterized protein B0H18DRAFT_1119774 [Fomitopsis serialis]|uniref:uncharacterized protein n=1 Tax=Fomitopsis serialis TaxID=139415 RepID=UPI0020083E95|nr:uncharacterized protein B0H18DRAFT_1119774 [Neoantrodia serialis]KAH9924755.1 hypothetical protein B0H18DRAFT_1119774 [Neoantrodia serialis]